MLVTESIPLIAEQVRLGKLIIYPTEAILGLGCDPFDEATFNQLLQCKQRSIDKGVILIASQLSQVAHLLVSLTSNQSQKLIKKRKKPITWLVPANSKCPNWLIGRHSSLAIRITTHPPVIRLCEQLGHALVSTSANLSGEPSVTLAQDLSPKLTQMVGGLLIAPLGNEKTPSQIIDLLSNQVIRE